MFLIVSWHEKDDEKEINIQFKFDDQNIQILCVMSELLFTGSKRDKKHLNT